MGSHFTAINTEKTYELLNSMQFRIPDRVGLEHYPFIVLDFEKGLAFFSNLPNGKKIPTDILQEIALLPSLAAMHTYIIHLD